MKFLMDYDNIPGKGPLMLFKEIEISGKKMLSLATVEDVEHAIQEARISDLSLVSMDDIWDELKRRFDAVLLVDLKSYDSEREGAQISFKGGKFVCIGLAEYARAKILEDSLGASTKEGEV